MNTRQKVKKHREQRSQVSRDIGSSISSASESCVMQTGGRYD